MEERITCLSLGMFPPRAFGLQVLDDRTRLLIDERPSKPRPHEHPSRHGHHQVRPLSATSASHCSSNSAPAARSLARPRSAHVATRRPSAHVATSRPASAYARISGRPPSARASASSGRGAEDVQGERLGGRDAQQEQEMSATSSRPRPQSAVAASSCRQAVKTPGQQDSIQVRLPG